MLTDPRTRMLSFTGSTEVGRLLLRTAADQVLKCGMELGGNAPFVVLADADVDAAVDGAMIAKLRNGGQACTAANRFFVQAPVHDAFVEQLVARMAAVHVGPGTDESTQCGPLINDEAVRKVDLLVRDALDRGARALLGGRPVEGPGCFYPPTLLVDVPLDARVLHEEVFGPVAPVVRFEHEEEVLAMVNDTTFGLVSYLYTGDLARGLRLAEGIESGMVGLNRGLVSDPAAPFGGTKQSGLGREGSTEGLLEFMETQYVATSW
jgi:succinate-semialdehyde dehydrogenase / glutarate-semialdehyde dehydrogenase